MWQGGLVLEQGEHQIELERCSKILSGPNCIIEVRRR